MKKNEITIGQTYTAKVSDKVVPVRIDAENPRGGWKATNLATNKVITIKSAQRLRTRVTAPAKPDAAPDAAPATDAPATTTPDADKLSVHVAHDRQEQKWFWSIREGKQEHHAGDDAFDQEGDAKAAGDKWLAGYAKANDAKRRKLLGWKAVDTDARQTLKAQAAADQENARLRDERDASDDGMTASERAMTTSAAKKPRKADVTAKPKKLSLLDAAAQVLADAKEPMNAKQMIEVVTAQGLWTPMAGRTPHASLYAAIIREIAGKADAARFTKTERGLFQARKRA